MNNKSVKWSTATAYLLTYMQLASMLSRLLTSILKRPVDVRIFSDRDYWDARVSQPLTKSEAFLLFQYANADKEIIDGQEWFEDRLKEISSALVLKLVSREFPIPVELPFITDDVVCFLTALQPCDGDYGVSNDDEGLVNINE